MKFIFLFLGMIFTVHLQHGFFMDWFAKLQGEGFEYHILAIGLAVAIMLNGSGKLALDNLISTR